MSNEDHKALGMRVVPTSYSLTIEPDLKTFKYKGEENIRVEVRERTNRITLNCAEIKILSASVYCDEKQYTASVSYNKKDETATLALPHQISGDASIALSFTGVNNDGMYGFYRSRYVEKGKDKYLLTTQFEAADARKAFPCFDEPELKATFDVTLVIDKTLSAISNMPIAREKQLAGSKKSVAFKTTPRMSTYLLYLGVGDFRFVSGKLGKLQIRVAAVPEKIAYARMALGFCIKFVRFMDKYFGVPYPLPKLDLIAIPDFAAGAMENWGAITFREVEILGDEKVSSVATRQRIAEVIAHELVHQWFGDLVTMKWWNDLWLNESFATFMSVKAVDATFPKWEMETQYYLETIGTAFAADQLKTTHPISVHVNDPAEISEIFDEISYEKGGSVLKMLEDYAGTDNFRKGLNIYLKRHAYSNATKEDLWNAIADASSGVRAKTFAKVAMAWIDKPGYPLVTATESAGGLLLSQERFMISARSRDKGTWPIPLHYAKLRGHSEFALMEKKEMRLHALKNGSAVKFNYGQKGLYRVRYPMQELELLGMAIKSKKMNSVDAWGIENDLYSLARSCRVPLRQYLLFVERYCMECDYPLSGSVSGHLRGLLLLLEEGTAYEEVRKVSLGFHKKMVRKLGWKKRRAERPVDTMLRSAALVGLGTAGDKATLSRALGLFDGYSKHGKEVDTNIRSAVYRLAAFGGNEYTFSRMKTLYEKAKLPDERQKLLVGLGAFNDRASLSKALSFSLSHAVRLQDAYIIPGVSTSTPAGRAEVWNWTRRNWKTLLKRFDIGTHMLKNYVDNLSVVSDARALREIRAFFNSSANARADTKKTLSNALELIEVNVRFLASVEKEFS